MVIAKRNNLNSELLTRLIQTYQRLNSELNNFLKPFGITLQQYNVLKILNGAKEPLSTSVIRQRMLEPMADASRLVQRLLNKGLVTRIASAKDKRLVDISITAEGIQFIDKLKNLDRIIENMYDNIDQEEAGKLNDLLNKLRSSKVSK